MKKFIVFMAAVSMLALSLPALAEVHLSVAESAIATSVEDRAPVGAAESFSVEVGTLYCFSKITGGSEGDSITHKWYRGEELMAEVTLDIKYANHRTWSSKRLLPSWTGEWKVEIADGEGNVLETLSFTVE